MGNCLAKHNKELETAIQGRKAKYVKKWLLRGADPNSYSAKSNYSFLSMAITLREEILVKYLLQHGADPDQISWLTSEDNSQNKNNANEFPIHIASTHGSFKVIETLLNFGADVNIGQGHKLGTALHQASKFGHYQIVELLLMRDADIIAMDSRMNIPLHLAARYGQAKSAQILLDKGSPVNVCNTKNWTPLHYAAYEGASNMVGLLIRNGADPTLPDSMGKTAIDVGKNDAVFQAFVLVLDDMENDIFPSMDEDSMKYIFNRKSTIRQTVSLPSSIVPKKVPPKPARRFTSSARAMNKKKSERDDFNDNHNQEQTANMTQKAYAAVMTQKLLARNVHINKRNRTLSLPMRNKAKMALRDLGVKQARLLDSESKKLRKRKSADGLISVDHFMDIHSKYNDKESIPTENPPELSRKKDLSKPIVGNNSFAEELHSAEDKKVLSGQNSVDCLPEQSNPSITKDHTTVPTLNSRHIDHSKKLCQDLHRLSNSLSNIKDMLLMSSLSKENDHNHNETFLKFKRSQSERTCGRKSKQRSNHSLEKTQSAGNGALSQISS